MTGAGSGIGRALAIEIGRRGALTLLVGRRTAALERTQREMRWPGLAIPMPADITSPRDRARIVAVVGRLGCLDLLVNNAGIFTAAPLLQTSDGEMEGMLATNVMAPFALVRGLVPYLQRGGRPWIVNVGSMFGEIAFPHFVGYSASKFALRGLSDGLRRELKPYGIGVTHAAPRAVRSESLPAFAHLIEPLGMTLDEPADVARRILKAAAAGRRSVYPAGPERIFVALARLWPRLVDRSIAGQLRRMVAAAE